MLSTASWEDTSNQYKSDSPFFHYHSLHLLQNKQGFAKLRLLLSEKKPGNSKISLKTPMLLQTLKDVSHPHSLHPGKRKKKTDVI